MSVVFFISVEQLIQKFVPSGGPDSLTVTPLLPSEVETTFGSSLSGFFGVAGAGAGGAFLFSSPGRAPVASSLAGWEESGCCCTGSCCRSDGGGAGDAICTGDWGG